LLRPELGGAALPLGAQAARLQQAASAAQGFPGSDLFSDLAHRKHAREARRG